MSPQQDFLIDLINERFETVAKNLRRHIIDQNGCWIWQGPKRLPTDKWSESHQYGMASIKYLGKSRRVLAHRLSYAFHTGENPHGSQVCHKCDTPLCINPDHLFLGSATDNMRDMVAKGRAANQKGASNGNSRLTEEDVLRIAALLPKLNNKQIAAALDHKVSHSMISLIRLGKKWSHLTNIQPKAA